MLRHSRLTSVVCVLLAAAGFASQAAEADSVLTVSAPFGGNLALIPSFNPKLGTLESVSVSIIGTDDLTLLTTPFLVGNPPMPIPYPISGFLNLGFSGPGFSTLGPGEIIPFVQGLATGLGGPDNVVIPIDTSFRLTATSDFTGIAPSDPPGTLFFGRRANFDKGPADPILTELALANFISTSVMPVELLNSQLQGVVEVQYDYKPEVPVTVPLPAPVILLGTVLAAAGATLVTRRRIGGSQTPGAHPICS